jgi:hypothetical protein
MQSWLRNARWLIAAGITLLLLAACGRVKSDFSTPEKTMRTFIQAYNERDASCLERCFSHRYAITFGDSTIRFEPREGLKIPTLWHHYPPTLEPESLSVTEGHGLRGNLEHDFEAIATIATDGAIMEFGLDKNRSAEWKVSAMGTSPRIDDPLEPAI